MGKHLVTVWNRGDLVRLKSGGPVMTVSTRPDLSADITQYSMSCKWFDRHGDLCESVFDSESVKRAKVQP